MRVAIEITFTIVVVTLIFLPVPPTTFIGIGLATNERTGKYMNPYAFRAVQFVTAKIKMVLYILIGRQIQFMISSREIHFRALAENDAIYL